MTYGRARKRSWSSGGKFFLTNFSSWNIGCERSFDTMQWATGSYPGTCKNCLHDQITNTMEKKDEVESVGRTKLVT